MARIDEIGFRGEDAEGAFVIEIRKERDSEGSTETTVVLRTSTVDALGKGVRAVSEDITSTLNQGQLTAINAILTKGLGEAKSRTNIS